MRDFIITFFIWAKIDGCQVNCLVFQCHPDPDILNKCHNRFQVKNCHFRANNGNCEVMFMVKSPIDQQVFIQIADRLCDFLYQCLSDTDM